MISLNRLLNNVLTAEKSAVEDACDVLRKKIKDAVRHGLVVKITNKDGTIRIINQEPWLNPIVLDPIEDIKVVMHCKD